jgi:predicted dehydrogenase
LRTPSISPPPMEGRFVWMIEQRSTSARLCTVPRIALIGLGGAAERIHLPACASLAGMEIAAACEPDADRRQRVGRRFGIRSLYAEPETLLAKERPEIVIIGTPPDTHRVLCLLALEHGAHVFCEKPFVQSVAEADEVILTAERHGLTVVVNNQYRYMPIYRLTQQRIQSGEYGEPFLIQCWQQMFHPPSTERNWRARLARSTLFEFGTHPLDLICFLFGALPLSIAAHMPQPRSDIGADVVVQATLRFPGERLATVTLNRLSHALERYLEMRVDCETASLRLSLGGVARASLDWSRVLRRPIVRCSLARGGEARVEAGGRSRTIVRERTDGVAPATARNLQELIDDLQRGTATNDRARHARELLRIVAAGYESARTGETVWLGRIRP